MQQPPAQRSALPTFAGVLAILGACISIGFQIYFISRVPTQAWSPPLVINSLLAPLVVNVALLATGLAVLLRLGSWRPLASMLGILLLIGAFGSTMLFAVNVARSPSPASLLLNWGPLLLLLRWLTGVLLVIAGSIEALQVGDRPTGGALAHFFSFSGRSLRCDYWALQFFQCVFLAIGHAVAWSITGVTLGGFRSDAFSSPVYIGVIVLFGLATIVSSLAVHVRRWHDQDKSGAWQLLVLLPFGGLIVLIFCGFIRGTLGPNTYGPDPSWCIAPPQPYGNPYPPQAAYPAPHYQPPPYHGR